jgi:hypothetical protein
MGGYVAYMGKRRGIYRALVGTPAGRRLLGRPSHRWEENIKMDIQKVGVWSELIQLMMGTGGGHL